MLPPGDKIQPSRDQREDSTLDIGKVDIVRMLLGKVHSQQQPRDVSGRTQCSINLRRKRDEVGVEREHDDSSMLDTGLVEPDEVHSIRG